jgi:hypothetical protein
MMHRVHQVLANTPRIGLPHTDCRRHDQRGGLSIGRVVVITVPRTRLGVVQIPNVSHSVDIAGLGSRRTGRRAANSRQGCQAQKGVSDHDNVPKKVIFEVH